MMATTDNRTELIHDALSVWAPTWPRNVTKFQTWAEKPQEAVDLLLDAERNVRNEPFISTYAFPRGHTKEHNIPRVDTLFIDFDTEQGDYEPGSGDTDAWQRDMSTLLVRARRVADMLVEHGAPGWRASLSGHKGIHLFLDFPPIPASAGDFKQFVVGVNEYANELVGHIVHETKLHDLSDYVDVTSGDLGRLHRVPNTKHGGATASFDEDRYCVAVTLEELADMTPARYEEFSRAPRPMPYDSRVPNEKAGEVIAQHVRTANSARVDRIYEPSYADASLISEYVNEVQNEEIELDDLPLLLSDRPCVWDYYHRDDKFQHGAQSHYMETFVIRELQEHNVPFDVMVEFFDSAPEFNEEYTKNRIRQVLSRGYHRFNVASVLKKAPEFMNPDTCQMCRMALQEMENDN